MTIIPATPAHAADIAQLIMTAMTEDCCQYLAGKEHTLDDFYHMMLDLVLMDDSQYSWRNAFVAVDEEATEGNVEYAPVAGAIVSRPSPPAPPFPGRSAEAAPDGLLADGRRDRSGRVLSRLAGYLSRISPPRHSTPTAETCH